MDDDVVYDFKVNVVTSDNFVDVEDTSDYAESKAKDFVQTKVVSKDVFNDQKDSNVNLVVVFAITNLVPFGMAN